MIIGHVVKTYTYIDECLNFELIFYFFGFDCDLETISKTEKHQNITHYILEELNFISKLNFVNSFLEIPKEIYEDILKVNTLRNTLVHSFFPESRIKSKPNWKGKSIYNIEALRDFHKDTGKIEIFLIKHIHEYKENRNKTQIL
jgi:hypothetical protein